MVVFNQMDVIRRSGHVTELSINFVPTSADGSVPKIFLYIVSEAEGTNKFVVVYQHEICDEKKDIPIKTEQLPPIRPVMKPQSRANNNDDVSCIDSKNMELTSIYFSIHCR